MLSWSRDEASRGLIVCSLGMATSQITLAPIVPAFLIYIGIVLSKGKQLLRRFTRFAAFPWHQPVNSVNDAGPVINDLLGQYWPYLLALIFIAAVEWTFAKTFLNNAACRGLTVTNPLVCTHRPPNH